MIQDMSIALQCVIVMLLQLGYIFFRTLNVINIEKRQQGLAVLSNSLVHVFYLVSTAIGVSSVMNISTHWPIVLFSTIGGGIATYLGVKINK